ncbi:penicillin-binding transpeptidase domain-containing protein, partial [Nonomuraea rubra]|uniref:penicillin-binding transpeptidase domain-containing protein n=1 Tax=Nonomuraea rubra TaxID=46180 RepID=UPI003CD09BEA
MTRMRARLLVLHVLVLTLLVVLAVRLWQVQVVRGQEFVTRATETRTRAVIVPAVRGQILDSSGRPLVRNKTALVVSVDRTRLSRMKDGGVKVLRKLSAVLGRPVSDLQQRITPCGPGVGKPCWTGSPYQPVPLDEKVDTREALQILERQEEFPGVTAEIHSVRQYPGGRAGAQMLGYLQPVTEAELEKREGLKASFSGVDLAGVTGSSTSTTRRCGASPGCAGCRVDRMGKALGVEEQITPVPGDHLVTSIDSRVQAVTEKALDKAMKSAPSADGGAACGARRAYGAGRGAGQRARVRPGDLGGRDLGAWLPVAAVGEVRQAARVAGDQRAVRSGFDVQDLVGGVHAARGIPAQRPLLLPGSVAVGGRAFNNFRGIPLGTLTLHTALVKSCDTIFYRAAYEQYLKDGGRFPKRKPKEVFANIARAFGFGSPTGVDLPGESGGRIPDRAWKKDLWQKTSAINCERSRKGYPEEKDRARAEFLKRLALENCTEGFLLRPGDSANFSIGQGDVLVTPMQLARAYAALVSDGKVRQPAHRVGAGAARRQG